MSDTSSLRAIADAAAAETIAGLNGTHGTVWVNGKPYRNSWVPAGEHVILDLAPRCSICRDTGILPKDSDLSPDEPCDCVYGREYCKTCGGPCRDES